MDSLYDVLGVASRANETAIRTAFRKAARSYHPDLNAGNPTAELQFRQIVAAYELLKDPLQREAYNQQLKVDRRTRARRVASPLISGVVSGGLVALTMWWFNTHKLSEPAQAPRVAVADIEDPAGQNTAAVTAPAAATASTSDTAARQNERETLGTQSMAQRSPTISQTTGRVSLLPHRQTHCPQILPRSPRSGSDCGRQVIPWRSGNSLSAIRARRELSSHEAGF